MKPLIHSVCIEHNMILELFICLLTTAVIYYWYSYKKLETYFKDRHVKFVPGWPVVGNAINTTLQRKHFFYDIDEVYKAFPDEKYVGYMENMKPMLIIRDPELIKLITVKDFDFFTDHKEFFSERVDPLLAISLFMMKGDKWRDMRTTLSPAFTGAKMKHMMHFMIENSKNIIEYLKEHIGEAIDVDDLIRRYTNDVIASTSFGLDINSLKDRDNEVFRIGQTVLKFNFRQMVVMFFDEQFPYLSKKLGLKLHPQKVYSFFKKVIIETIQYRKENNIQRPDMIQLLLETPKDWTIEELCAQAFIFFGAGFETSASALVMTIHELALNTDIQERLYQEIRTLKEELGDAVITSDNISSLKYLDCVLNETLRIWSPAIILDRKCTKTYTLPPSSEGGKPFTLHPGDLIYNSCNSIHLDPKYWPDPFKYDPDRWSEENKTNIKPFTFQPFGVGPRICIGSRFAIQEVKVLLYYLILNFKILKCEKTTEPIELIKAGVTIAAEGGTWVKFEARV